MPTFLPSLPSNDDLDDRLGDLQSLLGLLSARPALSRLLDRGPTLEAIRQLRDWVMTGSDKKTGKPGISSAAIDSGCIGRGDCPWLLASKLVGTALDAAQALRLSGAGEGAGDAGLPARLLAESVDSLLAPDAWPPTSVRLAYGGAVPTAADLLLLAFALNDQALVLDGAQPQPGDLPGELRLQRDRLFDEGYARLFESEPEAQAC